jgi:hypothetical protein
VSATGTVYFPFCKKGGELIAIKSAHWSSVAVLVASYEPAASGQAITLAELTDGLSTQNVGVFTAQQPATAPSVCPGLEADPEEPQNHHGPGRGPGDRRRQDHIEIEKAARRRLIEFPENSF